MRVFSKWAFVVACVLMSALCGGAAAGDLSGKKVVVVSGVARDRHVATNYHLVYGGIDDVFKMAGLTPIYQWAEMTYLSTNEAKMAAGDAAIAKAKAENPDLIIVLDDDALKFVGARIDDIPVVFGYIFGDPKALNMPRNNVTGIIRTSYAADMWRLANKLLGVKTVALISKYSVPMEGVKRALTAQASLLEKNSGVLFKDMFFCETFDEWAKVVKNFPHDIIYLADTSRIVKEGKELERKELTRWTVDNAKVPVIGAAEIDVEGGALFSIVTSERSNGIMAAETAIEILKGAAPSQTYRAVKQGKLVFNANTIKKYNLSIPYELLSSADRVIE